MYVSSLILKKKHTDNILCIINWQIQKLQSKGLVNAPTSENLCCSEQNYPHKVIFTSN